MSKAKVKKNNIWFTVLLHKKQCMKKEDLLMRTKLLAFLLTGILAGTMLAGCGSNAAEETKDDTAETVESKEAAETTEESADSSDTANSGEGKKYAIFIAINSNAFTMSVGDGAVDYGKEIGAEVTVFDGKGDQDTQVKQIETCITQGYDGFVIEPVSSDGAIPVIKQGQEAGIPMVTVIQECADQSLVSSFVGADHYEASVIQMESTLEKLGGKGKIAIINGQMGTTGQIQITEAFNAVLEKYPDVEVVEEQSANWVIDEALKITETWLQKYDDIDAIVGQSDAMALGAMKACQDAGTQMIISGRDAVPDALNAIEAGTMYCSINQGGPEMGAKSIEFVNKLANGETVEESYYTTNTLVTAENVADFK